MSKDTRSIPDPRLLEPPVARAAYSDRTAWLLAELSALAYVRFEGLDTDIQALATLLAGLTDLKEIEKKLAGFRSLVFKSGSADREKLESALAVFGFDLVETFNRDGTQAYLAKARKRDMAVLAFRGTEKDQRDIKADIRLRFYSDPSSGARTHTGFRDAFRLIRRDVESALAQARPTRLFVTGHSLGGALALVAVRYLDSPQSEFRSDSIAACYTYGSPRVGNAEFGDRIKPPIYRVVNAADIVPRLPPSFIVAPFAYIARLLPWDFLSETVAGWLDSIRGYVHHGDLRYLSASSPPQHRGLRLYFNPDVIRRTLWLGRRVLGQFSTVYKDHSIDQYREKLCAYALGRLGPKPLADAPVEDHAALEVELDEA
jgi:triacylglycerol lipase